MTSIPPSWSEGRFFWIGFSLTSSLKVLHTVWPLKNLFWLWYQIGSVPLCICTDIWSSMTSLFQPRADPYTLFCFEARWKLEEETSLDLRLNNMKTSLALPGKEEGRVDPYISFCASYTIQPHPHHCIVPLSRSSSFSLLWHLNLVC